MELFLSDASSLFSTSIVELSSVTLPDEGLNDKKNSDILSK
jgi:hypothetical protein